MSIDINLKKSIIIISGAIILGTMLAKYTPIDYYISKLYRSERSEAAVGKQTKTNKPEPQKQLEDKIKSGDDKTRKVYEVKDENEYLVYYGWSI